ncbi:hypothetical protein PV08_11741 [Exophiala spinifera]|uniref:Uncharacterized protein n=1 Tax=Exophiala spinifera TaxID=91928 RepID=A0A0D2AU19_9EURO|nr:uncharacterized protein PV08_11741 [Exophiala spinifera]KIW09965.1 hypothetical protein PV08_11741 [Exophiala spinifera]
MAHRGHRWVPYRTMRPERSDNNGTVFNAGQPYQTQHYMDEESHFSPGPSSQQGRLSDDQYINWHHEAILGMQEPRNDYLADRESLRYDERSPHHYELLLARERDRAQQLEIMLLRRELEDQRQQQQMRGAMSISVTSMLPVNIITTHHTDLKSNIAVLPWVAKAVAAAVTIVAAIIADVDVDVDVDITSDADTDTAVDQDVDLDHKVAMDMSMSKRAVEPGTKDGWPTQSSSTRQRDRRCQNI